MNKFLLNTAFVFALFFFQGCNNNDKIETKQKQDNESETEMMPKQVENKTIVFFGNSITAGYQLDPNVAFPALIQKRIDSLEMPYTCINAGLSGETTAGGVERVDWILKGKVDVFVLELGANDGLRGLPLNESKDNLITIIEKVRTANAGVRILLAGMEVPPNMGDEYILEFRNVFIEVANETQVELLPFLLSGVAGNRSLNLADGIHPNEHGHKIVMETVWKSLSVLL